MRNQEQETAMYDEPDDDLDEFGNDADAQRDNAIFNEMVWK